MAAPTHPYGCTLDATAWTDESEDVSPPSLCFVYKDAFIAKVYIRMDDSRTRDRWMLQVFPRTGADLHSQQEDGHYSWRKRPRRRLEPLLGQGELRFPRDTAGEAIKAALQKLAEDDVPPSDLTAIGKVAEILRPALERLTTAYVTRFRPR